MERNYLRRDEFRPTARAPAKLNVYLDVLGQRGDGYHELETVMVPVRLWDSLSMARLPAAGESRCGPLELTVRSSSPAYASPRPALLPPADERNLVVRALQLLRERSGCQQGARVELVKRIPLEAGLGGGSSDAAAALILANRVWQLGWSPQRLSQLAAELGSDVPFFIQNEAAICRGRGERVEAIGPIRPISIVIVKPPVGLGTADVYQAYSKLGDPKSRSNPSDLPSFVAALRHGRLSEVGRFMSNRLQAAAASLCPWVERVRSAFERLDCLGHQLSGSGTAYFGICRHAQHARRLAAVLRVRQLGLVFVTRTFG